MKAANLAYRVFSDRVRFNRSESEDVPMKYRNASIAMLVVVVLAMFGAGYAVRKRPADSDRAEVMPEQPAKATLADTKAPTSTVAPQRPLPPLVPQQPIDALMAKAMAGDTRAIRELSKRYDECYYYNATRNVSRRNLDLLARSRPEFRLQTEWIKRYRRERCLYVESGRPYDVEMAFQWQKALLELGDPVGELSIGDIGKGKTDPETLRKLQTIVERQAIDHDPEVAYNLSYIGRAQTGRLPEELRTFFEGDLSAFAWQVAACRAGYDGGCGWGSRLMNTQCEFFSQCQYISFEQMVLARHVPPQRRAEFFDAVRRIQARFL
jgi:hypothetical protein